jgi:hypothetical protein
VSIVRSRGRLEGGSATSRGGGKGRTFWEILDVRVGGVGVGGYPFLDRTEIILCLKLYKRVVF